MTGSTGRELESDQESTLPIVDRTDAPEGALEVEDAVLLGTLLENGRDHPDEVALRWKHHGIWTEVTWSEYLDRVRFCTLGLEDLGFGDGDVLFTIGYNRPQQLWSWFAAQALGGIPAPNYSEMLPDDIATQINLTEARVAFAEDQEMVDKILASKDDLPSLEAIVYRDQKGMFRYDEPDLELIAYETLEDRGRELATGGISDFEERVATLEPTDTIMLAPTSGTTGTPKRTRLTNRNFINVARSFLEVDPLEAGSDYFSVLPMPWIGEQVQLMAMAPYERWVVNFAEEEETTTEDFREIGPEFFLASPAMYEEFVADVKAQIENTTRFKRFVYETAMDIGHRYASYVSGENSDEEVPTTLRGLHWLSYWVAYRPILDKLGLKQVDNIYTGGAPLGEEHFQFYHALGLEIKQAWGQTEACAYVTVHREGDVRMDTAGQPLPNIEVGELDTGELVVRGPTTTPGYYRQPDKTEETIEDGWIHTDDFGTITDDGHVKILDRMDDVIEMVDGTTVAPVGIETRLKFNPYIKEAMVIGDDRPNLTAILNIRYDNVAEWADQNDIQYSGYSELSQHPAVTDLLEGIVRETNAEQEVTIDRFVSLFKEFNPDDGEITQTRKLRREPIKERYDTLIEALYSDRTEVEMTLTITYSDGRQEEQTETMAITTVGEGTDE
ncbi:AMP-binding protein [Natronomonas marina]|uniref:AMP-binding protein n=1 Tax=Natronomonas marina TaxID=2961939 RepID=UPI0020CA0B85|nr:AMP-binding protein [Natronomonas marina]